MYDSIYITFYRAGEQLSSSVAAREAGGGNDGYRRTA